MGGGFFAFSNLNNMFSPNTNDFFNGEMAQIFQILGGKKCKRIFYFKKDFHIWFIIEFG